MRWSSCRRRYTHLCIWPGLHDSAGSELRSALHHPQQGSLAHAPLLKAIHNSHLKLKDVSPIRIMQRIIRGGEYLVLQGKHATPAAAGELCAFLANLVFISHTAGQRVLNTGLLGRLVEIHERFP